MQKTQTNSSIVGVGFGEEVFGNIWVIVVDQLGQDIQVTSEDLLEEIPPHDNPHDYTKVYYDGKDWWIHKSNYFPM